MPKKKERIRTKVVVGHDPEGKAIVKWATGYTKREVEARKQELRREYVTGVADRRQDTLYRFYAQSWYDTYKKNKLSESSKRSYANALNNHILPFIGDKQLRAISAMDLQALMNRLEGRSSTLIGDVFSILRRTFAHACAHGLIDRDPALSLEKPSSQNGQRRALTEAEAAAALSVGFTHPQGLLLLLLYFTGARRGEVLGLTWGDIDFDRHMLSIRRDVDFVTGGIGGVKTPAAIREIPIPDPLYDRLCSLRGLPSAYVLPSKSGTFLCQATFKRLWKQLMAAMLEADPTIESRVLENTPKKPARGKSSARSALHIVGSVLTPHYFRHHYASFLYAAGVDPLTAQRILGHSDPKTTLAIYTHLSATRKNEDFQRVMTAFGSFPGTNPGQKVDKWLTL